MNDERGRLTETLDLLVWDRSTWDIDPPPGWSAELQRFTTDD
ncbi:hypothetical protein [Rhodococcus sp. (in: high G+C Gram-positive bacteria)]|nr:hypothetical protein [Rhodococcus sp. (in: high G+C Gram-positive bacteria)]